VCCVVMVVFVVCFVFFFLFFFFFGFLGGVLFVYGGQLARGCTSGAALSGMAVLSTAGFVTMIAIFGSAFAFAWFFRNNWI